MVVGCGPVGGDTTVAAHTAKTNPVKSVTITDSKLHVVRFIAFPLSFFWQP